MYPLRKKGQEPLRDLAVIQEEHRRYGKEDQPNPPVIEEAQHGGHDGKAHPGPRE